MSITKKANADRPPCLLIGEMGCVLLDTVYNPERAFDRLGKTDAFGVAVLLMVIRGAVTSVTTVLNMYRHRSPMFLIPPLSIDEHTYRYYEIFWYGPYTLLMVLAIALALFLLAKGVYDIPTASFKKTFTCVSFSFFTPWVPTVFGDYALLITVNARPEFLVPFHIGVLVLECCLISMAFRGTVGLQRRQAGFLGAVAGGLFIALGALFIR